MRVLASDIEAVGFYDSVHKYDDIHCLCSIDVETDEVYLFHDNPEFDNVQVWDEHDQRMYTIPPRTGSKEDGLKFWEEETNKGGRLAIHNCFGYDKLIVDKIWPDNKVKTDGYWDTYVQSKVQWFERSTPKGCKGAHGLQAYGVRCGINKPEVTDWEFMDAYKLHRVIEDCKIQAKTYIMLEKERTTCLDKIGVDFLSAIKMECKYSYKVAKQELTGAKVDLHHIRDSITFLDKRIKELAEEIEPQLPPTVKASGARVSRKEIAELLGYNPDKVKEIYITKRQNGEDVVVPEKPYYRPSVNYTREIKGNLYSGFHISYGESPKFKMKRELTNWIKQKHPDTKTKEWDIEKEETSITVLNKNTCDYFDVEETSDIIAGPFTRVSFEPSRMTQNEVVKGFLIRLGWKHAEEWNLKKDSDGGMVKAEVDTEVRWPRKAAPENQLVKKVKKGEPLVTSPKLEEDDYAQLPEGIGQKVAEYNTYQHRRRFLSNPKDPENKGIMSFVRDDGRIPCGVNNFNTATGRSSHRVWVNAPGEKSLFGAEIRKTIIADEGKKLVGCDQKSSQLSIAAFFAKNATYYDAVASGEEKLEDGTYVGESAHCYSARNFGIVSKQEWEEAKRTQDEALIKSISLRRSFSKGASFGVIFGCSGKKLAVMLKIPENEGNQKKNEFLKQMGLDGVKSYLETCKEKYKRAGGFYIPLAFGYWVWCKQDHKAINYLVQGTEALAQKLSELRCEAELERAGLSDKAYQILSMHDEHLHECDEDVVDQVGKIAAESFTWAADMIYKWYMQNPDKFPNKGGPAFKIDLSGGYEVGLNYGECH